MSQMLLKPGQIDALPHLAPDLKQQYKHGLANLWQIYEANPEGSQQRKDAENKIRTASGKLMQQLASARNARPGSGGGPQRPGQPQQGGMQQQSQMGQQGNQQQMAQAQAQSQARQVGQTGQAAQPAQPAGQQQQQRFERVSDKSQAEIDAVVLVRPPNTADASWEQAKANWRRDAIHFVGRRDYIINKARQMQNQMQQIKNQGMEIAPAMLKQFEDAKRALADATSRWNTWKARGEGQGQQQQQQSPNGQQSQQRPESQQGANTNVSAVQAQPQQQQQQDVKPALNSEQRLSLSPPQSQNGFQAAQQQSQTTQGPAQQSTSAQQTMASQQPPTPGQPQQQVQQNPHSATQPQPNAPNFPQPNTQQQQVRPPPINTQAAQNPMGVPQSNPASAVQPTQQRPPQALNHQQAMSQAAASYRTQGEAQGQQQQQQPQQPQPQLPNGLPFSQQPQSATQQNTPNSVYPNLQTTQQNSANTKFPIPKTLTLDPRTQTAVAGPPSRPTLNNQGMMYNPGVQRPPPYTLEGEGDRVLSKRKLDELVRQVTGAAPSSDNSESSSVLAPDVEESVLQVADNFVDSVITGACRLAKLRPNQTLDIRDVQMVLERNYGIRIPGYSLDEVRTVRKFQPAPGWQTKMQAVQAGKVMGSKDS